MTTFLLADTSLINTLIDALTGRLIERLQLQVTDSARAGVIRAGKLQSDPTLKKVNILIHPGGDQWPDVLNTQTSGPGLSGPAYSIGAPYGSIFFRRRFRIELEIFYPNEASRANTRLRAQVVLSRIHHAVFTMPMTTEADSFGESAIGVQVLQSFLREGGGDGDFNWRGEVIVEFLTELEPE